MEPTSNRLDRILTGLQHTLTLCDNEIGAITSQIIVREEALNMLYADTSNIKVQYKKYQETVEALKQKNEAVENRVLSSQQEIQNLEAKIENLEKSNSDPEVQTMIDHHKAAILHHEDILTVAKKELMHDRLQQEEIKQLMENLLAEMNKKPTSTIDEAKTKSEISQLKRSLSALEDARDQIVGLINKLDPNRIEGSGESKILHECEQKKRKMDDAFSRTPSSSEGGTRTKKMRPSDYVTPQKKAHTTEQDRNEDVASVPDAKDNPAAALLVPFLPPTAAKLLLVVDGRFESIDWYPICHKIPLEDDVANTLSTWTSTLQTTSKHFLLQSYKSIFAQTYRVVAVDPNAQEHDNQTLCVPLAKTNVSGEGKLLLDLLGEIEENNKFNYAEVWQLLTK